MIAMPAYVRAAAVSARPQVETKMDTTLPEPPSEAPNSAEAAQSPETPADAGQPLKAAEENPVTEVPPSTDDAPIAQAPSIRASSWPAAHPEPKSKPLAEQMYIVANVERDDVLNVRSGPSTQFDVVGELKPGSRGLSITGACRAEWCPVQHQSASGWVNAMYLAKVPASQPASEDAGQADANALLDPPDAQRTCLTARARALLERIEERFGPLKLVSTCRPGATIPGTGQPSRHANGNAVDFDAGRRKDEIVEWLIANHHDGGTMTYSGMDHVHVDIGPHFVSIAGRQHWASWRDSARDFPGRMGRLSGRD
jgi:hypothetical protein